MQSDIYARHGEIYLQAGLVEKAEELLGRAVELQPRRDDHVAARARVRLQAARAVVTDRARLRRLQGAIDDLERAVRSSPLMAEHHAAQGRAHETWAALTDRPREAVRHRRVALEAYDRALALRPHSRALAAARRRLAGAVR